MPEKKKQNRVMDFSTLYPALTDWVMSDGWIEIGRDDYSRSMARVLDEGGLIWEAKTRYDSIETLLSEIEMAIRKDGIERGIFEKDQFEPLPSPEKPKPPTKSAAAKSKSATKPVQVSWINVESSMIEQVRYFAETKTLEVRFNSGKKYAYLNVPKKIYQELLKTDSKGSYMRNYIIDCYPDRKF